MLSLEDRTKGPAAKQAKRASELSYQNDNRLVVYGWTIQPAIGRTGGVPNVGWEVNCPKESSHYFSTRTQCIEWVDKWLKSTVGEGL